MKRAMRLYSDDPHKMGWATFRKIRFSPKWENVACYMQIFGVINSNQSQFSHYYGLQWDVFHRRLIALSHFVLAQSSNVPFVQS